MTRCVCAACAERTLGGILILLDRGKLGMARMAIGSLTEDLKRHAAHERSRRATAVAVITAPKRAPTKRKQRQAKTKEVPRGAGNLTDRTRARSHSYLDVLRLGRLLLEQPKLRPVVRAQLSMDEHDLCLVLAARLGLSRTRWRLLWRALGRELP